MTSEASSYETTDQWKQPIKMLFALEKAAINTQTRKYNKKNNLL